MSSGRRVDGAGGGTELPGVGSLPTIRVLHVDYSLGFGGAVRSMSLLWRAVPALRPLLLTSQDDDILRDWYRDVEIHRFRRAVNYRTLEEIRRSLPWLGRGVAALDALMEAWSRRRVRALLQSSMPDLIHFNNGPVPREVLTAAHEEGIPCVVHVRGFPGRARRFTTLERQAVSHWVAVSRAVRKALIERGLPDSRISAVYNPVDLDRMDQAAPLREPIRRALGLGPRDVAVGIFGRVVPWKGHLEFLEALLLALDREPTLKGLVIGDEGDGDPAFPARVREMAAASRHADRFHFAGYQPDVDGFYHAMDIIAHSSIEAEPFGRTLVEGMAARRPVVASPSGGPGEVIVDGVDGCLRDPRNAEAVADTWIHLARSPGLRVSLGDSGRRTVEERFSLQRVGEEMREVFDRCRVTARISRSV